VIPGKLAGRMREIEQKQQVDSRTPIPKVVVARLSLYLRELQRLVAGGQETINSREMGRLLGLTAAQVRKDLAHVGHFGHPGVGYRCADLVQAVRKVLGTDRLWRVALVGVGNLGRALLGYKGFICQGFRIVAAFDVDPAKSGQMVEEVPVHAMDELPRVVVREGIRLGMLAVPAVAAQQAAEKLVAAGIDGIVNFAPVTISLPPGVCLVGVDLAIELEQISFSVVNRAGCR
jgi:redox-sensing transcriptional repressor